MKQIQTWLRVIFIGVPFAILTSLSFLFIAAVVSICYYVGIVKEKITGTPRPEPKTNRTWFDI